MVTECTAMCSIYLQFWLIKIRCFIHLSSPHLSLSPFLSFSPSPPSTHSGSFHHHCSWQKSPEEGLCRSHTWTEGGGRKPSSVWRTEAEGGKKYNWPADGNQSGRQSSRNDRLRPGTTNLWPESSIIAKIQNCQSFTPRTILLFLSKSTFFKDSSYSS